MGNNKVFYEAIPQVLVKQKMDQFLKWLNINSGIDTILKAAIAHFWFIIIHPFDDGNGHITRTITDKKFTAIL